MTYSNLCAVFVTSWFWLFICAVVSLFSYVNGLGHNDDSLNETICFSKGWKSGWDHGVECILDLAEKYDLATIRKAFESLKTQEEEPPE